MLNSDGQNDFPADSLLGTLGRDAQLQAARLVQEAFAAAFRLSIEASAETRQPVLDKLTGHLADWCAMAARDEALLRRVALMAGLDQWGVAFSRAFGPAGLDALSELVGALRDGVRAEDEAACQRAFDQINAEEAAGFDFKVLMRRELHLALWHAMVAADTYEEAEPVLRQLGSMLLTLTEDMPNHGWRLVADALATIQMRILSQGIAVEGLAQSTTQSLFASLAAALPEALRERILAQSSDAVRAWQAARRAN